MQHSITGWKPVPHSTMSIDIHQLPIPDWDVVCPACGYPLRGLPEHRCAECGQRFNIADVVKSWHTLRPPQFTGRESPLPDFGFTCDKCSESIAGSLDQRCRACGRLFDLDVEMPRRDWFRISLITQGRLESEVVAAELEHEAIPFRWETAEGTPQRLYMGVGTWARDLLVRRDFYFDARAAVLACLRRHAELKDRGPWTCERCAEENPPTFELCWKCGAENGPITTT